MAGTYGPVVSLSPGHSDYFDLSQCSWLLCFLSTFIKNTCSLCYYRAKRMLDMGFITDKSEVVCFQPSPLGLHP